MSDVFAEFLRSPAARQFYKNGPPHWTEGKRHPRPPRSMGEAKRLRDDLVAILSTLGPDEAELGAILAKCSVLNPCGSGACPRCGRAVQRWLVAEVSTLPGVADGQWSVISIVPDFGRLVLKGPPADTIRKFHDQIIEVVRAARIYPVIGGVDVSINEHQTGDFETHGQLHAWLLVQTALLTREVRQRLRSLLQTSTTNLRPLQIKAFDGRPQGIAYALKWTFSRRVTIPREVDAEGNTIRRRNTRQRAPRVRQAPILARLLHQAGFEGRIVLHGWETVPIGHNQPPRPTREVSMEK